MYTDVPESYASIVVSGVERTVNVTYAGLSSIVVAGPPDDCIVWVFAFVIVEHQHGHAAEPVRPFPLRFRRGAELGKQGRPDH